MTDTEYVGHCSQVISPATQDICDELGEAEVLVRTKWGLIAVWLCRLHLREHHAFYNNSRRDRRTRRASPNQGELGGDYAEDSQKLHHLSPVSGPTTAA